MMVEDYVAGVESRAWERQRWLRSRNEQRTQRVTQPDGATESTGQLVDPIRSAVPSVPR